jgi:hypothetical protein
MNGRKRAVRIIAVVSVALAAGQVAETLRLPAQASAPADDRMMSVAATDGLPAVRGITSVAATTDAPDGGRCSPTLNLAAAPSAMIDVALSAPCNRGERVVLRHAGLSFTALTNPDGTLHLQLPALEPEALVTAYFDGSQIALANVVVPDATDHIRFVVQMAYPAQFDLRAEEGGQVFVGSAARTTDNPARRILPLGNGTVAQPLLAQVYSFPADDMTADLSVEVKITPETCSRTLPAETLLARGGKITLTKLAVAVPLCGTSGDILVLKNLLSDLTLTVPK